MKFISTLKIGVSLLFAIALVYGGYTMFQRLSYNKQVFDTDIYEHIPNNVSSIIEINKEKDVAAILPFLGDLSSVIENLSKQLSFPILLPEYEGNYYLMAKLTLEQEYSVKEIVQKKLFPNFTPKEKDYNGTKLYFYPDSNNSFFVCMLHKGLFVGGYNYKLLESIIDTENSSGFFAENTNLQMIGRAKNSNTATIFLKKENIYTILNISMMGQNIQMDGFTPLSLNDKRSCTITPANDTMPINYEIFPDSIVSYQIDQSNAILSDSTICMFDAPVYQFYMSQNQSDPVFAIKHNTDRFDVYKWLNKVEQSFGYTKFGTRDVVLGRQRIYTTSSEMGRNVFNHKGGVHLSFYKGYLIFSADRNSLIEYLKHNGNYEPQEGTDQQLEATGKLISVFYSLNLNKWSPSYRSSFDNQIIKTNTSKAYIRVYIENNEKKIAVSLHN